VIQAREAYLATSSYGEILMLSAPRGGRCGRCCCCSHSHIPIHPKPAYIDIHLLLTHP
jgi:hypothetical protein